MRCSGTNRLIACSAALLAFVALAVAAEAIDPEAMLRLKAAGLGDATLAALIEEKSLATAQLSVDEIVQLKAAGVGEDTLRVLIRSGSFLKNRAPVVYGDSRRPLRLATIDDMIKLKTAGVSDDVLTALVLSLRPDADAGRRREALQVLEGLTLIIDRRAGVDADPAVSP